MLIQLQVRRHGLTAAVPMEKTCCSCTLTGGALLQLHRRRVAEAKAVLPLREIAEKAAAARPRPAFKTAGRKVSRTACSCTPYG